MALEWKIKHWSALGTPKADILISSNSVTQITDFSVDQFGNCQEATLTGLVSKLDLAGLDVMQLLYRPVAGTGVWTPLYAGEVNIPGVPKSKSVSEIKLVGLQQRLRRTRATKEFYGSASTSSPDDIGAIIRDIVNDARVSGGLSNVLLDQATTTPEGSAYSSIPTVGAVVGQITVNGYRVAGLLDLLCSLYTGLVWGVNADRKVFVRFYDPSATGSPTALTEGISGCKIDWKPATFEKICNSVDLYLSIPDTNDTTLYNVKDAASIAVYGEQALENPLVFTGLIEEILDVNITYSQSVYYPGDGVTPTNPNYTILGVTGNTGNRYTKSNAAAAFNAKALNDKEDGRQFVFQKLDMNYSYSGSGSFIERVELAMQAYGVGLIRIQGEFSSRYVGSGLGSDMYLYGRDTIGGVSALEANWFAPFYPDISDLPHLNNAGKIEAQNVRVNPYKSFHVLSMEITHSGSTSTVAIDYGISQFRPYKFLTSQIEAIAKSYMNTPNPDAASIQVNALVLPNTKITLNTTLYGTITKEAKLFKYTFTAKAFGITQIELEQPQSAGSTSSTALINNKDGKVAITSSQFAASVANVPVSSATKTFGSPLQFRPASPSSTGTGSPLIGTWAASGTGSNGEFGVDRTVGASGADITWAALTGVPAGSLIELSCLVRAKSLGNAALWLSDTTVTTLTDFYTVAEVFADVPGYFKRDVNSSFKVLLDANGRFKLHAYADNGASGDAMEYYLYFNGIWSAT